MVNLGFEPAPFDPCVFVLLGAGGRSRTRPEAGNRTRNVRSPFGTGVESKREHAFWRGSKPNGRGSTPNAWSISCGRRSTVVLSLAKKWFDMILLCIRDRRVAAAALLTMSSLVFS